MRVLISHDEIAQIAKRIGKQISEKYAEKLPIVVCVLKGAMPFYAELIKNIETDIELDFIAVSSYAGTESTGVITFKKDIETDISNRHVIVVEDIVDTGRTLKALKDEFEKRNPASLEFVTLLDKPSRRIIEIEADYVGKTIDDLFVIGFGLDLDEKYRNLKDVYVYNED